MIKIVFSYFFQSLLSIGWRLFVYLVFTFIPNSLIVVVQPSKTFALLYWVVSLGSVALWCLRAVVVNFNKMRIEVFNHNQKKRCRRIQEAKEKARHNVSKRTQFRDAVVRNQQPLCVQDSYNKGFEKGFRSGFKYTGKVKSRLKIIEQEKEEVRLCEEVRQKMEALCS